MSYPAPPAHPSGATPPRLDEKFVPRHVAVVMDGNGRWANERGLPRTEGHKAGEASLLDVIHGAIEIGVDYLSAYAFSTENWKRSPEEVRFLMGFNRDVIRRRRDELNALGVRIVWSGRRGRLWRSVIDELETAAEMSSTASESIFDGKWIAPEICGRSEQSFKGDRTRSGWRYKRSASG